MRLLRPASAKSDTLVAMLRQLAPDWTPEKLQGLIAAGEVPRDFIQAAARYLVDRPELWTISDEEFIAAVALIDPACAAVFRTPAGLDFMHRMSAAITWRLPMLMLGLGGERGSNAG